MNINNILKNQNLKLNLYTRYGDNEKNLNKGNKNSNTIESGNMVNQCMNNNLNCFNNIMNNEQVYLLNKNTIINSKANSLDNNFKNHNSIFVKIMNKDNNKFTFCNYNTNLSKEYNNYNYNFFNINNYNCQINNNNNNYYFINKNGSQFNSFQPQENNISNNINIFNNLVTNDFNINYFNIIQKNLNQKNLESKNFLQATPYPNHQEKEKYGVENFFTFVKNMQMPIIEYVCNSKGALELQKMLEKSGHEVKLYFIELLKRDGLTKIMKNVHGNYFFQKLIKDSNEIIISKIIFYILDDFINISQDDFGTFSLQALLDEVLLINDINLILQKIKGNEIDMIYDKKATYVIQKMVAKFPDFYRKDLNEIILQNFPKLCLDANGICLIKNFIRANSIKSDMEKIKMLVTNNFILLAQSPYGNYAIQFLMEKLPKNELNEIFDVLNDNIFKLTVQQYSSNVVEKSFEKMDEFHKLKIFDKLFFIGKFIFILKNKFGKFVIRKALNYMPNELKKKFELELINNINKGIYNQKDKNRVKKFLYKIQGDNNKFVNHNKNFDFCFDINCKNNPSF